MTVHSEVITMEDKLGALGRRIDALIADMRRVERKDVEPRVREEIDVWKQMLDELRVRAELGRMEARDRLEPVLKQMDRFSEDIDKKFEELRGTDEWNELDSALRRSLQALRREIAEAEELQK